jgi:hypothetical protein
MARRLTPTQRRAKHAQKVLLDKKTAADMPMFGYRPDYHSQAEADYDRLTSMAQMWTQDERIGQAFQAQNAAMPKRPSAADFSRAITEWMQYAPTSSPGIITAFAQANISPGTPGVQEALAYDSELQAQADAEAQNPGGSAGVELANQSWLEEHTSWLRGITRTAVDTAIAPLQAVQGGISGAAGSLGILGADLNGQEADWGQAAAQLAGIAPFIAAPLEAAGVYKAPNPWEQTVAGQSLLDFMGMPTGTTTGTEVTPGQFTTSTGDGWLTADENSGVGLAQRQATYQSARNKYNESWTLGRGMFSMVTESPDSTLYKVGSGLVDAVVSIFLDPTIIGSKAKIARDGVITARRLADAGTEADQLRGILLNADNLTREAQEAHALRLADLDAQIAADEKAWSKLPKAVQDEAKGLMDDEDALAAVRAGDQEARDAWVAAQREQATTPHDDRFYELTGQRAELEDILVTARETAARNAGRRTVRGRINTADEPTQEVIDTLTAKHGPVGLEDEFADLSTGAGQFVEQYPGGVLTNEVLVATNRSAKPEWVPSYSAAGETVAAWTAKGRAPKTLDAADDLASVPETGKVLDVLGTLLQRGGLDDAKAVGQSKKEILAGYRELLTQGGEYPATVGHLFSYAVSTGTTKHLARALEDARIDGIVNVRPILGTGEGGAWWTNTVDVATHALPETVVSGAARQALPLIRTDIASVKAQIKAIDDELKGITADAKERVGAAAARYEAYQAKVAADRLDESKALREQLLTQAGIQHTPDLQKFVDGGKMYDFLFRGRAGARAFQALQEMESPIDIMRVTGWNADTAARVAAAKTREDVLAAVAPDFGLSVDHSVGKIGTGLRYARTKAVERNRFYAAMARATGTFVPIAQRLDWADKDGMIKTLGNYMDYMSLPRSTTDQYLNLIIREVDESNQRNHVVNLFDELYGHLLERADSKNLLTSKGRDFLKEAAREGTRVYRKIEEGGHEYWQQRIAADAWPGHVLENGDVVRLSGAHIDSEFAQGGTILPDPRHIMEAMGRVSGLIARSDSGTAAYDLVSKITTDWWRTAMLLRGAYIIRNIAEEQIRMFLSGSINMFANPMRMWAVASSQHPGNGPMKRLAQRFSTYDQGIDGTRFIVSKTDERDIMDVHEAYLGTMLDNSFLLDSRIARHSVHTGIRMITPGETGFNSAWAHQLMALRASNQGRIVAGAYEKSLDEAVKRAKASGPVDERDVVMDWLFNHPDGAQLRNFWGKHYKDDERALFDDEQALRDYLYGPVGSVQARIDEFAAGQPQIREFIRTGVLNNAEGVKVWETSGRRLGPLMYSDNTQYDTFARVLGNHFRDNIPEGHQIKAPWSISDSKFKENPNAVDWFFSYAGSMERTAALGPEWKYAYWDEAAKRAHLLDAESLEKMRTIAKDVLPRRSPVHKILKDAKGDGPLNSNDVHSIAGAKAGEHVKGLFYDARTRNATWHQMRLIFPFGQAWGNTMKQWTKLAAAHPEQVYKFSKAMTALQQEGSNAAYEMYNAVDPFGDVQYDDTQGFFFRNESGQLQFKYPMAASPLSGLLLSTQDTQMSFSAPVSSLNLAFSGDNPLPGLGPVAVSGVGATGLTDKAGPVGDLLRAMAFPFGEPDPATGAVESVVPAWVKYAVFGAGFIQGGGEEFRRAQQKGALIATASRNDYGDLTDPINQKRWFQDADTVARMASFIRGMGSFILPASPIPQWSTKDKAGDWMPVATVAEQYRTQADQNGNDQAIVNLVEQYGEKGLAAILSSAAGTRPLSDGAYKFILANPDEATRIGDDTLALMFPGDPSPITLAWQRANGTRRDLSYEEKQDVAMGLLYRLQMAELYRAAESGGWDADQMAEGKAAVLDRFGGKVPPRAFDPNYYDNLIQGFRNAVSSPNAADIPATATAAVALGAYDTTLASYREYANDPRATLTGKKAALWRDELHATLEDLLAQDPGAAGVIDVLMSVTEEN